MLAAAVLAADVAGTFDVADRTEARARATVQVSAPQGAALPPIASGFDLFTQPQFRLRLAEPTWQYSLSYTPAIIAPDLELGLAPQLVHAASTSFVAIGRTARVTVGEDGTLGQLNTAFLLPSQAAPGQTPVVQPVAAPVTIWFGSSRTYGVVALTLTRREAVSATAEYFVGGGLDAQARTVIPEQYGPRATATFDETLDRRDHLISTAFAQRTDFTVAPCTPLPGQRFDPNKLCAPHADLAGAEEIWRHALSRSVGLTIGAGASFGEARSKPSDPLQPAVYPTGEASVRYAYDAPPADVLLVAARLVPYVDFRTGLITNSVQGEASVVDGVTSIVSLRFSAAAMKSVPASAPIAATVVQGGVEADFAVNRNIDLAVGERSLWQEQNGLGSFASTFGYFAVALRAQTLHF